jgi:hypothetical protein
LIILLVVIAPLFVLGPGPSRLLVAYDIALTIRLLNAHGLLGSSFVLHGGSLAVVFGECVYGAEFLRLLQDAVLRSDEVVLGSHIVITTKTADVVAVLAG